jgi:hypothetical protein
MSAGSLTRNEAARLFAESRPVGIDVVRQDLARHNAGLPKTTAIPGKTGPQAFGAGIE